MWKFLDTGKRSAEENMKIDAELLRSLKPHDLPILHFYDWDGDCATYGYFTKIERFFDIPKAEKMGLRLARRPTGGGVIFHIWDLAFSVLMPSGHKNFSNNALDNYQLINGAVKEAVKEFFIDIPDLLPVDPIDQSDARYFCMAKPTIYDVMLEEKKVAGAAQRKQRQGFLHQGSISLAAPKWDLLREVLLPEAKVLEAMEQTSYYVLGPKWTDAELSALRSEVRQKIKQMVMEL